MKVLFFIAFLANLVFFLWQYHVGAFHQTANQAVITNPEPKQIWLVSELKQPAPVTTGKMEVIAPTTVITRNDKQNVVISTVANPLSNPTALATAIPATPTVPVTPATKAVVCYQISGFTDKAAVTQWAKQQAFDESALQIKETAGVVADYLVNYPAAATFVESKKNIAILQQHGISDFFMINNGEFKGAISLGVFRNETRAIKVQKSLIQKGIEAKVSIRYKVPPAITLQLKTDKNQQQLLETLTTQAQKPRVEILSSCS